MIDPALRDSLIGYDDVALATLSNPGLVRRAHRDLAEGKVKWVSSSPDAAEVEADGQLVSMTIRGPRFATCACQSSAMCRHRIAAVLFLQTQDFSVEALDTAPHLETADPKQVIEALDLSGLEKWAGKASWRAAIELASASFVIEAQSNAVRVIIDGQDEPVLILRGQSFDGIESKAPKPKRKALHAAAVLLARRHFGLSWPAFEEVATPVAEPAAPEMDAQFLTLVTQTLAEVAHLGFHLAPLPLEESLFEISVSSRADNLPRLATALRAIAAQIRLRRQRALSFDPDDMLAQTASAFTLVRALAQASGERYLALAGKVRRDFHPAPNLTLIGCGGEHWHNVSGARGVTAWFVEPHAGRWFNVTLARGPGQDPQFVPGHAWHHQAVWQTDPLAKLCHAEFELEGGQISEDGRLSVTAAARTKMRRSQALLPVSLPVIIRDWSSLPSEYLRQTGLGLDATSGFKPCLISPTGCAAPYFDELSQQLVWPVRDQHGAWLALTLDHEEPASIALEALESLGSPSWKGMILVRLGRDKRGLVVNPVTLLGEGQPVDLTFWQPPFGKPILSQPAWLTRLRHRFSGQHFRRAPRDETTAAIEGAWQYLVDRVEAGPGLATTLDRDRHAHAERLDALGTPTLANLMRQITCSATLLQAAYGLLIARQQRSAAPLLI